VMCLWSTGSASPLKLAAPAAKRSTAPPGLYPTMTEEQRAVSGVRAAGPTSCLGESLHPPQSAERPHRAPSVGKLDQDVPELRTVDGLRRAPAAVAGVF